MRISAQESLQKYFMKQTIQLHVYRVPRSQ